MPRKAHIARREIVPDPIYGSTLVSKFVNCMMYGGKKSTAQQILYRSMTIIEKKTSDDPMKLFKKAVENVKPVLEVKSRRVGDAWYLESPIALCEHPETLGALFRRAAERHPNRDFLIERRGGDEAHCRADRGGQ